MDFKTATDVLFSKVDHDDLAKALKVSVASIRQARLRSDALAKRSPPSQWDRAVAELASQRVAELQSLMDQLVKPANFVAS